MANPSPGAPSPVVGAEMRPRSLGASFARSRPLLWQAAGVSVLVNLLMLTGPLFMVQIYDRVLASRSLPTLGALFALVVALFAFYGLFEYLRGRVLTRVGAQVETELDTEAFRISVQAARDPDPGRRRLHALRDLEALQQFFSGPAPMAVLDLPWSPLFFLVIFLFHWQLGMLAVAGAAVLLALALVNHARNREPAGTASVHAARAEGFERSVRSGAEAVRALGMMGAASVRWQARRGRALAAQVAAADIIGAYGSASKAIRFLLQSAMLAWGAWLAIEQQITPGMIIAASIMLGRALAPIDQTIGQWRSFTRVFQAWRRLRALFEDSGPASVPTPLPPVGGRVVARQLAVAPPGATVPVLRDLAFTLAPGQALGVIGPTGSGKSALARTLVGLWPGFHGSLALDGATLDQWLPDELGRQVGYLPQDVQLLDATVAENIARLGPSADEEVVTAATQASAHELILSLSSGYDTLVGPSGAALSGGQRQRIGLARALFGNPALVVLDEPNAHLDADGERAVVDVVKQLRSAGRCVIVMAHRPSAIMACDVLLVLADGRQRAFGPRDRVLRDTTVRPPHLAVAGGTGEVQPR